MLSVALVVCGGWVISLCLHEFGHAIVAYWGGDKSVKEKGYLTLNPLKYTDPTLSLLLPLIFLLLGGIALPGGVVYIDQSQLRHRSWQSAVAAAGPIATACVTLLLAVPFWLGLAPIENAHWFWEALAFLAFLEIFALIFNLLPIPPLDGYGILEPWLPDGIRQQLHSFGRYGIWVLFGLFWFSPQAGLWLWRLVFAIGDWLGIPSELVSNGGASFNQGIWIVAVAGMAIYLVGRQLTRKPHEAHYARADRLCQRGQYDAAVAAYDQALQLQPDWAVAWGMRGRTLQLAKRYEDALKSVDRAIELQSDQVCFWIERGVILGELQRYEEAIAACDQALTLQPDNGYAWYNRACCEAEQGAIGDALNSLRHAMQADYYRFRHYARNDTCFAAIKDNPRFQQMLRYPPHRLAASTD